MLFWIVWRHKFWNFLCLMATMLVLVWVQCVYQFAPKYSEYVTDDSNYCTFKWVASCFYFSKEKDIKILHIHAYTSCVLVIINMCENSWEPVFFLYDKNVSVNYLFMSWNLVPAKRSPPVQYTSICNMSILVITSITDVW